MGMTIVEAVKAHAIRAVYGGQQAQVLPVTPRILASIDPAELRKTRLEIHAGQLLVVWKDSNATWGVAVDSTEETDLQIVVRRLDGKDEAFDLICKFRGVTRLPDVARENERRHAAIREGSRGTAPLFADTSFGFVPALLDTMAASISRKIGLRDRPTGLKMNDLVVSDSIERLRRSDLSWSEIKRAEHALQYREILGHMSPRRSDAVVPVVPPGQREDDGEFGLMPGLIPGGVYFELPKTVHHWTRNILQREMMSLFTTTHHAFTDRTSLNEKPFSDALTRLAPFSVKQEDWGSRALAVLRKLLLHRMPDYRIRGAHLFNKDGSDILMIRDDHAFTSYRWSDATRRADPAAQLTSILRQGPEEAPTVDDLAILRTVVQRERGMLRKLARRAGSQETPQKGGSEKPDIELDEPRF